MSQIRNSLRYNNLSPICSPSVISMWTYVYRSLYWPILNGRIILYPSSSSLGTTGRWCLWVDGCQEKKLKLENSYKSIWKEMMDKSSLSSSSVFVVVVIRLKMDAEFIDFNFDKLHTSEELLSSSSVIIIVIQLYIYRWIVWLYMHRVLSDWDPLLDGQRSEWCLQSAVVVVVRVVLMVLVTAKALTDHIGLYRMGCGWVGQLRMPWPCSEGNSIYSR